MALTTKLFHPVARYPARGVTLIELMAVIAIIGIIFSIATPSYYNYVIRAQRGEATACLVTLSQALERRYIGSSQYDNAKLEHNCIDDNKTHYTITSSLDKHTYIPSLPPTSAQPDWACGVLTYTNNHKKGLESSSASGKAVTGTVENCW